MIVRYGYDAKTPLLSLLGEDDTARLKAASALARLPVERLGSARPWLAAYQLEHAYAQATGHAGLSANQVLAADAHKAGVPIRSEFPAQDDTIAAYGALSPAADLQFLRLTLDDILAAPGEVDRENGDWARGALGPATARVRGISQQYPDLYRALIIERNRGWLPRIADMLPGQAQPGGHGRLSPARSAGRSGAVARARLEAGAGLAVRTSLHSPMHVACARPAVLGRAPGRRFAPYRRSGEAGRRIPCGPAATPGQVGGRSPAIESR